MHITSNLHSRISSSSTDGSECARLNILLSQWYQFAFNKWEPAQGTLAARNSSPLFATHKCMRAIISSGAHTNNVVALSLHSRQATQCISTSARLLLLLWCSMTSILIEWNWPLANSTRINQNALHKIPIPVSSYSNGLHTAQWIILLFADLTLIKFAVAVTAIRTRRRL